MQGKKEPRLISGNVGKILFNLTVPMIVGILSMVIFNLADTFFVGRLGTPELAALGFTLPVILIVNSLALGLGTGAMAVISRAVGQRSHHKVERLTTDSLLLAVLTAAFFVILGFLTIDPIFRLLGVTEKILPLIKTYMTIWYLGVIFVIVPMTGNNAIRSLGDTKTPSLIMLIGAGCNIILDPLLIFGIGPFPRLEIAGAAIATVIARAITFSVSLYVLIRREKMITFDIFPFKNVIDSWKQILFIGLPTSATRLIAPVAIGFITALMATYGAEAVAAFGVSSRIEFFALSTVVALSSVIAPFVGQNWGAKKLNRVNLGVKKSNLFALAWGLFSFALLAIIAKPLASVFNNDPMVISTTVLYLRIVPIGFGLIGVLIISSSVLNVLHKPLHASFLMLTMMFVLFVPLAFLGSHLFDIPGIFAGIAIAYLISGIIAHFTLSRVLATEEKNIV